MKLTFIFKYVTTKCMNNKYNHKIIDKKWQKIWDREGVFKTGEKKGKKKRIPITKELKNKTFVF